jgi:hypothetical protein
VAWFGFDIVPKRIELLKEIVPQLRHVRFDERDVETELRLLTVLTSAVGHPKTIEIIEQNIAAAAGKPGFAWLHFRPAVANDYDEIFARAAAKRFDAAYIIADPLSTQPQNATRIIQPTMRYSIPTIGEVVGLAKGGLLLAYGQDSWASFWRCAKMGIQQKTRRPMKPTRLLDETLPANAHSTSGAVGQPALPAAYHNRKTFTRICQTARPATCSPP